MSFRGSFDDRDSDQEYQISEPEDEDEWEMSKRISRSNRTRGSVPEIEELEVPYPISWYNQYQYHVTEPEGEKLEVSNPSSRRNQYLAGLIMIPQMVTHGTVMTWPLVSSKITKERYGLSDFTTTWFTTVVDWGGFFAMILLMCLLDRVGSKHIMFTLMFPCICGWLFITFAAKFASILSGRLVTGFCSFTLLLMVPVYMAECAEAEVRGYVGLIPYLGFPIGVLYVTSLDYVIDDLTWLSFMCVVPPVVGVFLLMFVPESPYYQLLKNDVPAAEKTLQWLRGKNYDITEELSRMRRFVLASDPKRTSLNERLKRPGIRRPLLIGIGIVLAQQLSGIHAMVTYLNLLAEETRILVMPAWTLFGIISGFSMLFGILIAILLCDRVGRKPLLIGSSCVMGVAFLLMGFLLVVTDVTRIGWLVHSVIFVYHFAFGFGWGPLTWFLVGELFPLEIRSVGLSVSLMTNLVLRWTFVHCYTALIGSEYMGILYFFYGFLNYVAAVSVYFFVIETKRKSLDEIKIMFEKLSS